jgi:hypothetical protein
MQCAAELSIPALHSILGKGEGEDTSDQVDKVTEIEKIGDGY